MKLATLLAATVLAFGANAAAAQPAPQAHDQHQATVPHQAAAHEQVADSQKHCCCEEMMHKMMMEMMRKHQSMGMPGPKANADPNSPEADDHQHKQ